MIMSGDINFHLGRILNLEQSEDQSDLAECIQHCNAVFELAEGGCPHRAMKALHIAKSAEFELPEWAISYFDCQINGEISFPRVVPPDDHSIEQIRALRQRKNVCNCAVWLLDNNVLQVTKFGGAKLLLETLNRYWVNGGSEGTEENPFLLADP